MLLVVRPKQTASLLLLPRRLTEQTTRRLLVVVLSEESGRGLLLLLLLLRLPECAPTKQRCPLRRLLLLLTLLLSVLSKRRPEQPRSSVLSCRAKGICGCGTCILCRRAEERGALRGLVLCWLAEATESRGRALLLWLLLLGVTEQRSCRLGGTLAK